MADRKMNERLQQTMVAYAALGMLASGSLIPLRSSGPPDLNPTPAHLKTLRVSMISQPQFLQNFVGVKLSNLETIVKTQICVTTHSQRLGQLLAKQIGPQASQSANAKNIDDIKALYFTWQKNFQKDCLFNRELLITFKGTGKLEEIAIAFNQKPQNQAQNWETIAIAILITTLVLLSSVTLVIFWRLLKCQAMVNSHQLKQLIEAKTNSLQVDLQGQQQELANLHHQIEQYTQAISAGKDGLWDWKFADFVYPKPEFDKDHSNPILISSGASQQKLIEPTCLNFYTTGSIDFSASWKAMLGYQEDQIGNSPEEWLSRVHQADIENLQNAIANHFNDQTPRFENEHRLLHADGTYRWMLTSGFALRDRAGNVYRIIGTQTDITEQKLAEQENQRLAAFVLHNPNPVLASNPAGEIIYINPVAQKIIDELDIKEIKDFLPVNHLQIVQNCITERESSRQIEAMIEDQVFAWTYHPIANLNIVHLYAIDITETQRMAAELRHDAFHDTLTGLPNRALFLEQLGRAVARAKRRADYLFAVLFLDMDRFNVVNDSLGHLMGDQLLIAFARRLQACIPFGHLVARFGGDEFTILVENIHDISDATSLADRIHTELSTPFHLSGHEVFTTASIGIAWSATGYDRPADLLRDADLAMYRAKARGKARHEVFDSEMLAHAVALLQLENDLRRAIFETEEFQMQQTAPSLDPEVVIRSLQLFVHYQPIISLDNGKLAGFEALVRWQHPTRGMISPVEFIPVAEETGLIVPLGNWVLREAANQLNRWQVKFPSYPLLTMNVNLSGIQLAQPNFIEQIDQILQETGIQASSLKLEITESVLMENANAVSALLEALRSRQIQLCIDDFGTGYSSLSYLHRFPINMLKIDKSFISRMGKDNENEAIVRAIVMLAHNLGMYVTAEGVETQEQLVQLWALQCEYGQGYFFAKPLSSLQATALIASTPQW